MTEGSVWHPGAGLLVLQSPLVEQTQCMHDSVFLRKGYCGRGSKKKKKKKKRDAVEEDPRANSLCIQIPLSIVYTPGFRRFF